MKITNSWIVERFFLFLKNKSILKRSFIYFFTSHRRQNFPEGSVFMLRLFDFFYFIINSKNSKLLGVPKKTHQSFFIPILYKLHDKINDKINSLSLYFWVSFLHFILEENCTSMSSFLGKKWHWRSLTFHQAATF